MWRMALRGVSSQRYPHKPRRRLFRPPARHPRKPAKTDGDRPKVHGVHDAPPYKARPKALKSRRISGIYPSLLYQFLLLSAWNTGNAQGILRTVRLPLTDPMFSKRGVHGQHRNVPRVRIAFQLPLCLADDGPDRLFAYFSLPA